MRGHNDICICVYIYVHFTKAYFKMYQTSCLRNEYLHHMCTGQPDSRCSQPMSWSRLVWHQVEFHHHPGVELYVVSRQKYNCPKINLYTLKSIGMIWKLTSARMVEFQVQWWWDLEFKFHLLHWVDRLCSLWNSDDAISASSDWNLHQHQV